MNSARPHHDAVAEEQAALWAARLDGDTLDAAQRAELDGWLARNPAHRALLSHYCQLSADLEEQVPSLVTAGVLTMPENATSGRRRWRLPWIAGAAFASAAAAAVAVVALRPAPLVENVATSPNQRREHTLADGTHVQLNAHTSLRFENTKTERRARLADGEAFFTVAKDSARPFIVETPGGAVRVTGTIFNVRTGTTATTLEVTVVEGSVQVRPSELGGARSSAPRALKAGEQLVASAADVQVHTLAADALENTIAWRGGYVVFNGAPLKEVAERFAHYHGRSITIAAALENEPIGGRYKLDDLSAFFADLESALPGVRKQVDPSGAISVHPSSR